ncbi:hypothetical protein C8F04DRAFT_1177056 [Mycena alexandri]|uniref:Uncharacterized protein n=1 Tax=Mycena alexandri TaxID=1745969 RepID=A0AAD6XB65_9AGAR|nr:hypothetical protein C8F04DRAFT_1177056 [Mycena alexandri]
MSGSSGACTANTASAPDTWGSNAWRARARSGPGATKEFWRRTKGEGAVESMDARVKYAFLTSDTGTTAPSQNPSAAPMTLPTPILATPSIHASHSKETSTQIAKVKGKMRRANRLQDFEVCFLRRELKGTGWAGRRCCGVAWLWRGWACHWGPSRPWWKSVFGTRQKLYFSPSRRCEECSSRTHKDRTSVPAGQFCRHSGSDIRPQTGQVRQHTDETFGHFLPQLRPHKDRTSHGIIPLPGGRKSAEFAVVYMWQRCKGEKDECGSQSQAHSLPGGKPRHSKR